MRSSKLSYTGVSGWLVLQELCGCMGLNRRGVPAKVFKRLFEHDPDIIGPVAGQYTLLTDPVSDHFVISLLRTTLV
jgi:hypothetical protein